MQADYYIQFQMRIFGFHISEGIRIMSLHQRVALYWVSEHLVLYESMTVLTEISSLSSVRWPLCISKQDVFFFF